VRAIPVATVDPPFTTVNRCRGAGILQATIAALFSRRTERSAAMLRALTH
jgi:hypothetical protein